MTGADRAGLCFEGPEFLPAASEAGAWLARLRGYLRARDGLRPDQLLGGFLGREVSAASFHVAGVHHLAAYAGDYRAEQDHERWLAALAARPEVAELRSGPSHIAPRYHGTPGHWVSCRLDGRAIELFSCKHAGPWRELPAERRRDLMSHFALAVDGAEHVEPLLRYLAHYPAIELLCFAAGDELGHVYGHLLNRRMGRVLELVHDPARAGAGSAG